MNNDREEVEKVVSAVFDRGISRNALTRMLEKFVRDDREWERQGQEMVDGLLKGMDEREHREASQSVSDEQIDNAMRECGNNRTKAAKLLKISTRTLQRRMRAIEKRWCEDEERRKEDEDQRKKL